MLPPASALTYCLLSTSFLALVPLVFFSGQQFRGWRQSMLWAMRGTFPVGNLKTRMKMTPRFYFLPCVHKQVMSMVLPSISLVSFLYITSFHSLRVHAIAPRYSHILLPFQNTLFSSTTHSCHLMDSPSSSRTSALLLDEAS